ncbi:zinc-dependent alcohol dehydrogenase [Caproiciproducens sp. CPB-2]|uniref:zinc-dependent alcohol dehydrogenase n=1 Tax=Caproiciproducens sp. CPB-2 TaxID=3030017 RepID=UPI0023DCA979|nr:alcohol dehydrogenase catalytic domain-containing protein [Caproiciproducens sp. CPB-2]MDF1494542.1 alcohol dehydrogenase catalytic domain-containing protein [Caproiciproducens sp. CPB-2]
MDQTETMRFAVLEGVKKATVHTRRLPKPGAGEVLLKNSACNICTTDYGQWLGLRQHQPFPKAVGHETSGVIIAKGPDVGEEFQVGDHVAIGNESCGECRACKTGRTSECTGGNFSGAVPSEDGYYGIFGCSDYLVKRARALYKMEPSIDPSEAAFLEPLATVAEGCNRLRIQPKERIAVIGAGTMGLLNAQVARTYGCRVFITEMMDKKLNTAADMGFDVIDVRAADPVEQILAQTDGEGVDAVIVAVGATSANEQAIRMLKKLRGRALFFAAGYPAPELHVDSNLIHYRKLELIGTYSADRVSFVEAARLLNEREVDVSHLIEARFPLDDLQQAYEAAATQGAYRVSVLL